MTQERDESLKDPLEDAVGGISEAHIDEALAVDDAAGFRAVANGHRTRGARILRRALPIAACFCLLTLAVFRFGKLNPSVPSENAQLANPITAVTSHEELSRYLGTTFPELPGKEVVYRHVLATDGRVFKCDVRYTDGTSLGVSVGEVDDLSASGVWGGSLVRETEIGDVPVRLYRYENTDYAILTSDGYTYCYYLPAGTVPADGNTDGTLGQMLAEWVRAVEDSKQN